MKCKPYIAPEISFVTQENTKFSSWLFPINIKLNKTKDQLLALICSENPVEKCNTCSRNISRSMLKEHEHFYNDRVTSIWRSYSPTNHLGVIKHLDVYSKGIKTVRVYRVKNWDLEPDYSAQ